MNSRVSVFVVMACARICIIPFSVSSFDKPSLPWTKIPTQPGLLSNIFIAGSSKPNSFALSANVCFCPDLYGAY